ncbi:MAG: carboxypeptidase-like regulatory domain-containing protein [Candidatus Sericytochromatia bacterium]
MLNSQLKKGVALAATLMVVAGCTPAPTTEPSKAAEPSASASSAAPSVAPSSATPSVAPSSAAPSAVASSVAPSAGATPSSAISSAPSSPTATTAPTDVIGNTSDIKERATFNGKVYDTSGVPVENATVTAKSVDPAVTWVGEAQQTQSGAYVFRNAPVGARLEITVKKDGWTTRTRTEVLKSNLQGDPNANVFEFGVGPANTDAKGLYAIQDEPEVTSLKINGKMATDSDTGSSTLTAGNRLPDSVPGANLTGISSDSLTIEMTFSEPVRRDDVQNYFRALSTSKFDTRKTNFTIDANLSSVSFVWAADDTAVTVKTSKGVLSNKGGDEARYLVDFTQAFRDKTDKPSKSGRTFRFSASKINDFHVFSVKNQDQDPYITGIQAIDGGSANDVIKVTFSKPMDVINQTVPQALLAAPNFPNDGKSQLFAYNTNNVAAPAHNATVLGFMDGANGTGNFKYSYVVGRIKSADLRTNNLLLNPLGGFTTGAPIQYGANAGQNPLKSAKVEGNVITLEFNPQAFDKDDRVILASASNIAGSYNDKVNNIQSASGTLRPTSLNLPTNGDFLALTDPSGRTLDSGNSSTSANIDITNAQKVATAN